VQDGSPEDPSQKGDELLAAWQVPVLLAELQVVQALLHAAHFHLVGASDEHASRVLADLLRRVSIVSTRTAAHITVMVVPVVVVVVVVRLLPTTHQVVCVWL
jgi:hypothetical protein